MFFRVCEDMGRGVVGGAGIGYFLKHVSPENVLKHWETPHQFAQKLHFT